MRRLNKGQTQIKDFSGNRQKSPLLTADLDQMVARLRSLSNMEVIQSGSVPKFVLGDERSRIIIPDFSSDAFFPFKIYNIENLTSQLNNPLTFQVRSGIVGWRPYFNRTYFGSLAGLQRSMGNFEVPILCPFDNWYMEPPTTQQQDFYSAPLPNKGGDVVVLDVGDTLIFETPDYLVVDPPQIVLSPASNLVDNNLCSLWIKITDNPAIQTYAFASLYARMFSPSGYLGRTINPFPDPDPSIIPIGIINSSQNLDGLEVEITQILSGNLTGRWTRDSTSFRGFWDDDGLSGQIFYPGDVVVDDSIAKVKNLTSPAGSFSYFPVYTFDGDVKIVTDSPTTDPTDWLETGSQLA